MARRGPTSALKEGPFWTSTNSVAKHQKIEGDPLGKRIFQKKSQNAKKLKRDSPGIVCYAEIKGKVWFSSLDQMVQFDTIKFRRTILVSSCGLKKNHYNSRVSLHEDSRIIGELILGLVAPEGLSSS